MLPRRRDLKPTARKIPRSIVEGIRRFGGRNPYGEPMFRLSMAEDRIIQAPGAWAIWPEHLSVEDRGGFNLKEMQQSLMKHRAAMEDAIEREPLHECEKVARAFNHEFKEWVDSRLEAAPKTVHRGLMDVELYSCSGYILEKWHPAEHSGPPSIWEEVRIDGMPAAGPYPEFGDYWMFAGPTPYMPSLAEVQEAIRKNIRDVATRPWNRNERVRLLLEGVERKVIERDRRIRAKADSYRRETDPIMKSLSLGAGRIRQELADRVGLKGNYGN